MLFAFVIVLLLGLASSRPSDKEIANIDNNNYCGCTEAKLPQCGCCVDLEEFNYTVCANLSYIAAEYGIRLTLMINGEVYINETLSGKNPPPMCHGLIGVADFCVKMYNISYEEGKFGGCLELYADFGERIFDLKLGCWYMDDGIGIPVSEENITEDPADKPAKIHSLFEFSNSAKQRIFDEMYKWSDKDGDLGVSMDISLKHHAPKEPWIEEYENEETNDSF